MPMKRFYHPGMDVIAHRGYSGAYPENTMLSFMKAEEAGADGIELDVHLSKDGELMIIHDEALIRTCGKDGFVYSYTRSELEDINAGKTKNDAFGFTPIPSLEEFLSWLKETSLYVNIELKTMPVYYPGIEEKTVRMVESLSLSDRVIYSSFNWLSVFRLKEMGVTSKLGLLIEGPSLRNIGAQMKDNGIECYHPAYSMLSDESVRELKDNGRMINVWTVNDDTDIQKCLEWGIDGLITNETEKARRILSDAV